MYRGAGWSSRALPSQGRSIIPVRVCVGNSLTLLFLAISARDQMLLNCHVDTCSSLWNLRLVSFFFIVTWFWVPSCIPEATVTSPLIMASKFKRVMWISDCLRYTAVRPRLHVQSRERESHPRRKIWSTEACDSCVDNTVNQTSVALEKTVYLLIHCPSFF